MSVYSERDLESMLSDLESDLAERKEAFKGEVPTKAREAVCAFANDLPDHGTPGDGAIGGHAQAVQNCYRDFRALALEVAKGAGVMLP